MIKVILKEDVIGQGKTGDVVDVSDGFARNFLIPKDKAIIATPDEIKKIEEERNKFQFKEEKIKEKNVGLKEKIESLEVVIEKKAKEGKLFGGLSPKEISEKLEKENLNIDPKKIKITNPIKTVGEHKVGILLDKNVEASLKVKVAEE